MSVRFVQQIGAQFINTAGNTTVITTTNAAQVGQFLVLAARIGVSLDVSSISDSAGNTWSKLNSSALTNTVASVWYCTVTSVLAASSTITVTYSNTTSGNRNVSVWAFEGVTRPTTTNATNRTGGTTTLTVGNVTPERYGSLLFTAGASNQNTTHSVSAGWTALTVGTSSVFLGAAYAISSMASLNATWTIGTTGAIGAVSGTFTPDGGDAFLNF